MKPDNIQITFADDTTHTCKSIIIAPDTALCNAATITCNTRESKAHVKHQFHSIGQMALFLFEDGELEAGTTKEALHISYSKEKTTLLSGIILYIDAEERLHLISNSCENIGKLLQAVHRYCTRWIRLDI